MDVPKYDAQRGLHFEWDDGFEIAVELIDSEIRLVLQP